MSHSNPTFRVLCCALLFMSIAFPYTSCYPSGAPDTTCDDMMPHHDDESSQDSTPPFSINLSDTTAQAGGTITVNVKANDNAVFKGLLLKAISVDTVTGAAGSFNIDEADNELYHTINCSNVLQSAVSHSTNDNKTDFTTTWIAPLYNGKFVFKATVVQEMDTFWAGFTSADSVEVIGGTIPPPTNPPSTSPPTTPSTPSFDYDYDQCGRDRSCMGYPSDCISRKSCSILLTFRPSSDDNSVSFEMISATDGYVAMGLSTDQYMGDDSVLECLALSSGVTMYASTNNGKHNEAAEEPQKSDYFTHKSSSFNDGVLKCEFSRQTNTTVDGLNTNMKNNEYYILLAVGPLNEDGTDISKHSQISVSTTSVNLTSSDFIVVDGSTTSLAIEIIVHGSLMVIAWIVLASVAVFLARFYKDMWPEKLLCNVKIWFAWHRGLNTASVCITLVSLIVILVYSGLNNAFEMKNAHPIMGIITCVLMIMQPIGAVFRPHPGDPNRKIFNWLHFTGGMLACVCGVITIYLAVYLKASHLPQYFYYIISGFVVFYVLMFACMECLTQRNDPKTKKEEVLMKTVNGGNDKPSPVVKEIVQSKKMHYKAVLLYLFTFGVVGFAVAMISIIAIS